MRGAGYWGPYTLHLFEWWDRLRKKIRALRGDPLRARDWVDVLESAYESAEQRRLLTHMRRYTRWHAFAGAKSAMYRHASTDPLVFQRLLDFNHSIGLVADAWLQVGMMLFPGATVKQLRAMARLKEESNARIEMVSRVALGVYKLGKTGTEPAYRPVLADRTDEARPPGPDWSPEEEAQTTVPAPPASNPDSALVEAIERDIEKRINAREREWVYAQNTPPVSLVGMLPMAQLDSTAPPRATRIPTSHTGEVQPHATTSGVMGHCAVSVSMRMLSSMVRDQRIRSVKSEHDARYRRAHAMKLVKFTRMRGWEATAHAQGWEAPERTFAVPLRLLVVGRREIEKYAHENRELSVHGTHMLFVASDWDASRGGTKDDRRVLPLLLDWAYRNRVYVFTHLTLHQLAKATQSAGAVGFVLVTNRYTLNLGPSYATLGPSTAQFDTLRAVHRKAVEALKRVYRLDFISHARTHSRLATAMWLVDWTVCVLGKPPGRTTADLEMERDRNSWSADGSDTEARAPHKWYADMRARVGRALGLPRVAVLETRDLSVDWVRMDEVEGIHPFARRVSEEAGGVDVARAEEEGFAGRVLAEWATYVGALDVGETVMSSELRAVDFARVFLGMADDAPSHNYPLEARDTERLLDFVKGNNLEEGMERYAGIRRLFTDFVLDVEGRLRVWVDR